MGFFATIGRGWEMSKLSMAVVKKDPTDGLHSSPVS